MLIQKPTQSLPVQANLSKSAEKSEKKASATHTSAEPKDSFFETPVGMGLAVAGAVGLCSAAGALGRYQWSNGFDGVMKSSILTGFAAGTVTGVATKLTYDGAAGMEGFQSLVTSFFGTIGGSLAAVPGAIWGLKGALVASGVAGAAAAILAVSGDKS